MALYNNGLPMGYQPVMYPQYQPVMPQPQASQQQNTGGLIWVQGEAGAKSYLVAPNTTVQLWDSEKQVIYLKSADASGLPSMKVLEYKIRDNGQPQGAPTGTPQSDFATRADVEALYGQINALRAEIDGLTIRKAPARTKKEADDE